MPRNLFSNYLDYELVGGQWSNSLEVYLDVTANWWGTLNQPEIWEKIFDFEDWNSYAIAEYYPFLVSDDFRSPISTGGKKRPDFDLTKPFGGRISTSMALR